MSVWVDFVKNDPSHAWLPGHVLGRAPGDLPDGHLAVEIPEHVLDDIPGLHPGAVL